ncbi:leucine-rich repeat-containing protein 63-like [Littorina saxatilis]|uniref:Uncharacterized protein n=1 Tax=Littorina saxatilis TaxID=31220 RepID=A0AAN9G0C6_9CAEN
MFLEGLLTTKTNPDVIPGLSGTGNIRNTKGKLLRRPRAPPRLPPLTPEDEAEKSRMSDSSSPERHPFAEVFDMFDLREEDHLSPVPSGAPSLASPPPSESAPTRNTYPFRSPASNVTSFVSRDDEKYVLDPMFRGRTSLGTYVDGKGLGTPFKSRGPEAFPPRAPKQIQDIMLDYDCDDIRFFDPPAFTLEHFMAAVAERSHMPMRTVREIVTSRHNVKRLTDLLADEKVHPHTQRKINTICLDPEEKNVPLCEPRIPQHQLLLEMAAMIKQHMRLHMHADVRTIIRPAPKFSPSYHGGDTVSVPHTEIILYEDDLVEMASVATAVKQESEAAGTDVIIHSARSRYFQDSAARSHSPYASPEDGSISPSELAILDSLIAGGTVLSLKAHFIDALPDISPLSRTLVYLNLSFNNFQYVPMEILDLWQLEVLKLRDNPLVEIPQDIDRLRNLKVFIASYCLLTTIPPSFFTLENLEHVSVAYNKLTFIPNEIKYLQKLEELDVEGNMLPALPAGVLCLRLVGVRVKNNLMHPLFWKEHTRKEPQRLMHLAMLDLHRHRLIPKDISQLPDIVQRLIKEQEVCDCCQGPRYGPGIRMIRPVPKLFGVKHLPIMFQACSPTCYEAFRGMGGKKLAEFLYGVDTSA